MAWLTPNAPTPTEFICRRLRIPAQIDFIAAVNGALVELTREWRWEAFGTLTPEETAAAMQTMFLDYLESDVCLIGSIIAYASAQPPNTGILECDGSTHLRVDYPRLYEKLDPAFVLDADSFTVPDLRGRTVIGAGKGSGLTTRAVNDIGGEESVTLAVSQIPEHDHTTQPHSHTNAPHSHAEGTTTPILVSELPDPIFPAALGTLGTTGAASVVIDAATVTVDSAGGGEGHENMPPFVALRYGIVAR